MEEMATYPGINPVILFQSDFLPVGSGTDYYVKGVEFTGIEPSKRMM